ncbi:uncharacterized protein C6orf226 homolog [Ambystoma mexicanum]|uniref:uncharacterized protein C6orf226 homolog n=1 Tax=Ambystoma mexicanum TaxID=8296 RepID=UPI0037E92C3B
MAAQEKGAAEEVVQIWDKRQDLDLKPHDDDDDDTLPRCGDKGDMDDPIGGGLKGDEAAGVREPGCGGEEGDEDSSVPFSEILQLVQSGQEIPGLQKLNINATQESPTASQMPRRSKPWETTV